MSDEVRSAIEHTIETPTHGRYLVSQASPERGAPLLLGFHGYGETAEEHLRRLRSIPGTDRWIIVSIQGLHQFYRRRTDEVVASWMTRQNRDLAIAANIVYVSGVVHQVVAAYSPGATVVAAGFSQGVSMAYRAAAALELRVGVLACGGDVPPELNAQALSRIPMALIGRGVGDEWYTQGKMESDEGRLRAAGVETTSVRFEGSHEWPPSFAEASSRYLESSLARNSTL